MTDDNKYPKTAKLRQQREAKHEAEQVRQKLEALREEAVERVKVKARPKQYPRKQRSE